MTKDMSETDLMKICVGAHEKCFYGKCDYCEIVYPLRYTTGKFAPNSSMTIEKVKQ